MRTKTWGALELDLSNRTRHLKELLRKDRKSRGSEHEDRRPWLNVIESMRLGATVLEALWAELSAQRRHDEAGFESGIAIAAEYCEMALEVLGGHRVRVKADFLLDGEGWLNIISPLGVTASLWRSYVRFSFVRYEAPAVAVWRSVFPLLYMVACMTSDGPNDRRTFVAHAQRDMFVGAALGALPCSGLQPAEIFALDLQLESWVLGWLQGRAIFPISGNRSSVFAVLTLRGEHLSAVEPEEIAAEKLAGVALPWWVNSSDTGSRNASATGSDDRLRLVVSQEGLNTRLADAGENWSLLVEDSPGEEIFFAVGYGAIVSAERQVSNGRFSPNRPGFRCGLLHKNKDDGFAVVRGSVPEGSGQGIVPGSLVGCRRIGWIGTDLRLGEVMAVHRSGSAVILKLRWLGRALLASFQVVVDRPLAGTGLLLLPASDAVARVTADVVRAGATLLIPGDLQLQDSRRLTLASMNGVQYLRDIPFKRREGGGVWWLQLGVVDS